MNRRCWEFAVVLSLLPLTTVLAEPVADVPPPANAGIGLIGPALRSTDLDRTTKFYTTGLGMVIATTLKFGSVTEVIFGFSNDRNDRGQAVILIYRDEAPGKSLPIEHGNGFDRLVLRVPDAMALSKRLAAAGYSVGEMHANPVNHMKVFWAEDPDGYKYEITELSASRS